MPILNPTRFRLEDLDSAVLSVASLLLIEDFPVGFVNRVDNRSALSC